MAIAMRMRRGSAVQETIYHINKTRATPPARTPDMLTTAGAAIITAAVTLGVTLLPAQAQFTRLTGFGDSYADTGYAPGGAFRLLGAPYYPCTGAYESCRFTGGTNFVDTLQSIYGLPLATNFSIGGARTDNTNTMAGMPPNYGFQYEREQLALSGMRFTNRDLIALSIGGNDLSAVVVSGSAAQQTAQIETAAAASAQRAVAGVKQMVEAGARNIAWLSTGSSKWFPQPPGAFTDPQRDDWANTYYQQTQQLLAPLARSGVRIFLFNFGILQQRVAADPARFGFSTVPLCEAGPWEGPGPTPPAGVQVNVAGCFYENSVHPTGPAMALIARYMANQIDAPTTVVPQGAIATSLARGFTASALGRLDAERGFPAPAGGYKDGGGSGWSVYGNVNYGAAKLERQFLAAGYDYDAIGGIVGAEYRVNPRLLLGGVFGYSTSNVSLGVQDAHDRVQSYQLGGYGSFTGANLFADAFVAYGSHDYALDRQGVMKDIVHGSTSADTLAVAAKAGYLFDAGPVRVGPIAGLNYTRAVIGAYTETGDSLLTMRVNQQDLDALTGDAGLQLRFPLELGGNYYSPFINVTAERDFGSSHMVTTTQVTAPLLPVLTPVSGESRTYGKIAAGVAARIAGNVSGTVNAETTFARDGGNGLVLNAGIKVGF
jgi:outer membrane lipase/esterase